jgi:hypothetical protein
MHPARARAALLLVSIFALAACGGHTRTEPSPSSAEPSPTEGPSSQAAPTSLADDARSIQVTREVLMGGAPCMQTPYGAVVRFDVDLGTGEIVQLVPRCPTSTGVGFPSWDGQFMELRRRTIDGAELASVVALLRALHEGPRPAECAMDGPQLVVDVTRGGGKTTYQDGDTNCYDRPDVKYVDAPLDPLFERLRVLGP